MLGDTETTGGWAGLTEMTPDHHALLGPMPGVEGLIIATGFSGHGVMHAPATGLLLAELLLDGEAHSMDIAPLSPARFAEGRPLTETMFARPHEQGDIASSGNRQ
jgi:sarcosine oxidase subunit beta